MYKKVFLILCSLAVSCVAVAATDDNTNIVKGFKNLESIQNLSVINNLSAIADNDNIVFSKIWPREYFSKESKPSYIYFSDNENRTMDIIRFEYSPAENDCYTKYNPEFCLPKINPIKEHYVFNERLIVERIPNFIDKPKQKEVFEVLMKDNKYFDTMRVKSIKNDEPDDIYRKCDFEKELLKSCQTFDKNTDELLFSEELVLKEELNDDEINPLDKVLKYIKFAADGQKMEEYFYSNGKHIYYDEKGNISIFEQFNDSKFKYYNTTAPELYIDVEFTKNEDGQILAESHFDSNHRLIRQYSALYNGGKTSRIKVKDIIHSAEWDIIPLSSSYMIEQLFAIRY